MTNEEAYAALKQWREVAEGKGEAAAELQEVVRSLLEQAVERERQQPGGGADWYRENVIGIRDLIATLVAELVKDKVKC